MVGLFHRGPCRSQPSAECKCVSFPERPNKTRSLISVGAWEKHPWLAPNSWGAGPRLHIITAHSQIQRHKRRPHVNTEFLKLALRAQLSTRMRMHHTLEPLTKRLARPARLDELATKDQA